MTDNVIDITTGEKQTGEEIESGEVIETTGELVEATFDDISVPRPVIWEILSSDEAEQEWLLLNEWVEIIRRTFLLPAQVVPPFWHRHPILVEHLSALRTHYLGAFDLNQNASAPFGWIRDLAEWEARIREVVARLGTRIDADRPGVIPLWPGEPTASPDPGEGPPPVYLPDRYVDFLNYVAWDIHDRRFIEGSESVNSVPAGLRVRRT